MEKDIIEAVETVLDELEAEYKKKYDTKPVHEASYWAGARSATRDIKPMVSIAIMKAMRK